MGNGFPVRLSASLAARAKVEAEIQERSLTDQVEHWARLGQVVETAIAASTVARLKARSHDPKLPVMLAAADTAAGRAKAVQLIRDRHAVAHGVDKDGEVIRAHPRGKVTKSAVRR